MVARKKYTKPRKRFYVYSKSTIQFWCDNDELAQFEPLPINTNA